eukprot:SM005786S18742  [mRNA]  locus=s5786:442:911:- [translate_table: standard]
MEPLRTINPNVNLLEQQLPKSGGGAGSSPGDDGRGSWRHEWQVALLHAKGAVERNKMSGMIRQGQGSEEWKRIQVEFVGKHPSFSKDMEACRQKYKRLVQLYKAEKRKRGTSGEGGSTLRGNAAE